MPFSSLYKRKQTIVRDFTGNVEVIPAAYCQVRKYRLGYIAAPFTLMMFLSVHVSVIVQKHLLLVLIDTVQQLCPV